MKGEAAPAGLKLLPVSLVGDSLEADHKAIEFCHLFHSAREDDDPFDR
jgi:hypothetical protein